MLTNTTVCLSPFLIFTLQSGKTVVVYDLNSSYVKDLTNNGAIGATSIDQVCTSMCMGMYSCSGWKWLHLLYVEGISLWEVGSRSTNPLDLIHRSSLHAFLSYKISHRKRVHQKNAPVAAILRSHASHPLAPSGYCWAQSRMVFLSSATEVWVAAIWGLPCNACTMAARVWTGNPDIAVPQFFVALDMNTMRDWAEQYAEGARGWEALL